ncbi:hypothetical protein TH63_00360 [Rufibacter radiotolerans]|uniref:Uncharacterized protein n=1 Tax=Rufibacter radiotolerans TaxID=1379910 RepID=A0A0H4VKM4_9BACT|nr:hypothetical protein [Rufibacter radiotolerans]AKQ44437.1 hypothetical protein TH63_00360 [Rufibacter radiotolerans]
MAKLTDIIQEFNGRRIPYSVLLSLEEWKSKRQQILNRTGYACERCKVVCIQDYVPKKIGSNIKFLPAVWDEVIKEVPIRSHITGEIIDSFDKHVPVLTIQADPHFPEVHHTYYILDKFPWEYPNESLMVVCHKCHQEIHNKDVIKIYEDENMNRGKVLTPCSRCQGTGYLYEYDYYKNGICFQCNGARFKEWR